jgi:hypothetical protein
VSASVDMAAEKNHTEATYTVSNGQSTAKSLSADLGKYGKVDVTFHPRKTTHPKPPQGCHGSVTRKTGVWKGTIKFRGEGFTSASAHKAHGTRTIGLFNCSFGGGQKQVLLNAYSQQPSLYRSFTAQRAKSGGSKPHFSAVEFSDGDNGVSIGRFAFAGGKAAQFTYNPGYTHADVAPPGAFKGSATFDNGTWTGNLKVSFPGEKNVPLTGPTWTAQLSELEPLKVPDPSAAALTAP